MMSLLAGIFLVVIFALFSIASDLNTHADSHNKLLLMKALENRQAILRFNLSDNAEWGEAYKNLHLRVNFAWAWDAQNLGKSLFTTFGYDGIFVIGSDGKTRYSVIDGQLRLNPLDAWLGVDPLPALLSALKQSNGKPVSRLVALGGQLTLLAAEEIQPGGDSSVTPDAGPASLMVFADQLSPDKLHNMGLEYGIDDVRLLPDMDNQQSMLKVPAIEGDIYLTWRNGNPGGALLTWILPILIFLMCFTLVLSFILMRNALLKARLNDESTNMLEQSRQALAESERRFRDVVETTADWIWETDLRLRFTWISGRFPVSTGYSALDWLTRPLTEFLRTNSTSVEQWKSDSQPGDHLSLKHCRYISAQGEVRYCNLVIKRVALADGRPGFRGTATDVTSEVEAQARVRYLSHHDELTGLANRIRMKEFLEACLNPSLASDYTLAMLTLDLDKFKPVNDLFGHASGDDVLNDVAARLRECMPENGLIARHGGDEFILIVPFIRSEAEVEQLCQLIFTAIRQPFYVQGNEIIIGASIGIALAPKDACTSSDLLRFSDIALYQAKNTGRNCWVFYRPEMGEQILQRREMENEMRDAIQNGQFHLTYQPRYDVKSNTIYAVEALVRWHHPHRGVLMPDQFIPLAEETGLIVALSDWVLLTACTDVRRELGNLSVSVNISAVEFEIGGFAARILSILAKTGLPPSCLELEITESAALKSTGPMLEIMHQLRALGVRFLIDDFGTGYSSLNYLNTFPFDGIKLDKTFIQPIECSENARQVVEHMIGLGKAWYLEVTAEGVEEEAQMTLLKAFACDALQGYYFGRPVSLETLKEALKTFQCKVG